MLRALKTILAFSSSPSNQIKHFQKYLDYFPLFSQTFYHSENYEIFLVRKQCSLIELDISRVYFFKLTSIICFSREINFEKFLNLVKIFHSLRFWVHFLNMLPSNTFLVISMRYSKRKIGVFFKKIIFLIFFKFLI